MFDYQAGEKYKLTLIMVGITGVVIGIFFASLFLQPPDPRSQRAAAAKQRYGEARDVTARRHSSVHYDDTQPANDATNNGAGAANAQATQVNSADMKAAQEMVEKWLPTAWDLSAATASQSQELAISYMTPDCANAYRQNVWTPEMKLQITQSGLQSQFQYSVIQAIGTKPDGSVVVSVLGEQILQMPDKPPKARPVKLEYLVKQTPQGMKISGISEGNNEQPSGS